MRIVPGSYVEIRFEISYMERGEKKIVFTTRKKVKRKVKDEKLGKEKEIEDTIDIPRIAKVGVGEIPRVLENSIISMEVEIGKKYKLEIPPERAYGVRDPKKIEIIPLRKFRRGIDKGKYILSSGGRRPKIGDFVYFNETGIAKYGKIINISDRTVVIDWNHPLAGKKIDVEFIIDKIVFPTNTREEKMKMILKKYFGELVEVISFEFISDDTLEIRVGNAYFARYPRIDEESARRITEELYAPRLLFLSEESEIYSEFGVTKIRWIEEREIKIVREIQEKGNIEYEECVEHK